MSKVVDTREYLDMVCGLLAEGRTGVPVPVAGSSMTPFLHHGDTVYLDLPKGPLKKGDIALFVRPSGQYILHRIVKINQDGSLILLGDAQLQREWVAGPHMVRAVVTSALHGDKLLTPQSARWRFFGSVWMYVVPLRPLICKIWGGIKKLTR